jgi:primosomal protein N' (replication factor Y)
MILQIAVHSPLRRCFDYLPPLEMTKEAVMHLQKGVRIRVPFRNKTTVGILVGITNTSTIDSKKLKAALEILDEKPLFSPEIFELLLWASDYYQHPLGEVFSAALPGLLRKGRLLDVKASLPLPSPIPACAGTSFGRGEK